MSNNKPTAALVKALVAVVAAACLLAAVLGPHTAGIIFVAISVAIVTLPLVVKLCVIAALRGRQTFENQFDTNKRKDRNDET